MESPLFIARTVFPAVNCRLTAAENTARMHLLALFFLMFPIAANSAQLEAYRAESPLTLSLPDLSGQQHALADYRGSVVLVNFWASWCAPCVYEMPGLVSLKQRHAGRPFEILAVNVGENKFRVHKFVSLIDFTLPVLLDTSKEVFHAWGLEILPTSFLVDPDGRVRYRVLGSPDWDNAEIGAMIEALMPEVGKVPAGR